MIVNATEFKNQVGKYLNLVNKEEIIISRNGKQIAKLVPIDKPSTPNVDGLLELLSASKNPRPDLNLDKLREERFNEYENLT